jgi:hypothetical protein
MDSDCLFYIQIPYNVWSVTIKQVAFQKMKTETKTTTILLSLLIAFVISLSYVFWATEPTSPGQIRCLEVVAKNHCQNAELLITPDAKILYNGKQMFEYSCSGDRNGETIPFNKTELEECIR